MGWGDSKEKKKRFLFSSSDVLFFSFFFESVGARELFSLSSKFESKGEVEHNLMVWRWWAKKKKEEEGDEKLCAQKMFFL